jgi:hypothetical protein
VCSDYTLQDGHELGNHLKQDLSGYYCHLAKEDFRQELLNANQLLLKEQQGKVHQQKPRWIRAP